MSSAGTGTSSSRDIFARILRLQRQGRRAVLATPIAWSGSLPLSQTSKLLLSEDGSTLGTVGGGLLEAEVMEQARRVLSGETALVLKLDLAGHEAARSGMVCGGRCSILLEPIAPDYAADVFAAAAEAEERGEPIALVTLMPAAGATRRLAFSAEGEAVAPIEGVPGIAQLSDLARASCRSGRARLVDEPARAFIDPILPHPRAVIFGGGHVAVPVALMADLVGFRVVVVDDREEFANRDRFPRAHEVIVSSVSDAFRRLSIDDDSYVVAVTRGHAMDEDVVAEALRTPARYIGMIGSRRKVGAVLTRLRGRGFSEDALARVHAPIGIDISSETVEEIGVSIVAELIAARRREP